jgi:hypothetical protein
MTINCNLEYKSRIHGLCHLILSHATRASPIMEKEQGVIRLLVGKLDNYSEG